LLDPRQHVSDAPATESGAPFSASQAAAAGPAAGATPAHGHGAGAAAGQPAAAVPSAVDLSDVSASMERSGVRAGVVQGAGEWISKFPDGGVAGEEAKHPYDLSAFEFLKDAGPKLAAFGNAMHAKGYSQADVAAVLTWYTNLPWIAEWRGAISREVETMDLQ